jgi:c-di-GMP-binding flagellar brake protein YcgR
MYSAKNRKDGYLMSVLSRDYQEKRNFIRMKIDTPADIIVESDGSSHEGVCRDLSGGGMLVELANALPVGTSVVVKIQSSHGHAPMLEAVSQVTRVETNLGDEASPCLLGMQITEVIS